MGTVYCIISPDLFLQDFPPSTSIPAEHQLVFSLQQELWILVDSALYDFNLVAS